MQDRRRALIFLAVILALAALAAGGLHAGARMLRGQVLQALGPNSEIGAIRLRWNAVEIEGLRIRAPAGWPAGDELRAARIRVEPDLRGLLSRRIRISAITVHQGYLSLLRTGNGRLRLLPSLLEKPTAATESSTLPTIEIGRVELVDNAIEFFDASIRKPPHRIRLERLQATVEGLSLPALDGRSKLDVQGVLKGVKGDGTVSIQGWFEVSSKDSVIETRLRKVDLLALQPYLIRAADTGVKRGTLDLDLTSSVKRKRLHADGKVTLSSLELDEGAGAVMGLPRKAMVSLMQDRNRKIAIRFALDGNLDDPKFKLNESLAARVGAALAESLGVSFEGIAKGAGSVGSAVGAAAQGVGKAIKGLFGN